MTTVTTKSALARTHAKHTQGHKSRWNRKFNCDGFSRWLKQQTNKQNKRKKPLNRKRKRKQQQMKEMTQAHEIKKPKIETEIYSLFTYLPDMLMLMQPRTTTTITQKKNLEST